MAAVFPDVDIHLDSDNPPCWVVEDIPCFEYLMDQSTMLAHICQQKRRGKVYLLRINFFDIVPAQDSITVFPVVLQ